MVMNEKKGCKCDICGLAIDKDSLMVRNKKSYHSKCFNELIEREKKNRRNAIKIIGLGTAIATASLIGGDKLASAAYTIPRSGGGTSPRAFVLPQLFFDPINPQPGEMWYRIDKGVTAYHDGITNRNIYSNSTHYITTVSAKGIANGQSTIPNDGKHHQDCELYQRLS